MGRGQEVREHVLCEERGEGSRGTAEAGGVPRGETFSVAITGTYLLRSWETDWDEEASQLHPRASLEGWMEGKCEDGKCKGKRKARERREQSTIKMDPRGSGTDWWGHTSDEDLEQVEGSGIVLAANLKVPKWV